MNWTSTIFDNVLFRGDEMYLQSLNGGLILENARDSFLSLDELPKFFNISCKNNEFTCEICLREQREDVHDTSIQPNEAIDQNEVSIVVQPVEANKQNEVSIVVQPIEATKPNRIRVVKQRETTKRNETSIVVQTVDGNESCSRNEIHNICQLHATTIEKQICYIHFGQERQGLIVSNVEIDSHYHDIHSALLATFFSNIEYAILVLEWYMMALIKQNECYYLCDSHARDSTGMPCENGTAVVMKFDNMSCLEQHLYCLSLQLHSNLFELVSVQLIDLESKKEQLQKKKKSCIRK